MIRLLLISFSFLFLAGFFAPLQKKEAWQILKYSKLKPSQNLFTEKGLIVKVNQSASPLIYPFEKPKKIKSIRVKAHLKGPSLNFPSGVVQGSKGYDDFPLRVGLVRQGEKTLSWLQRRLAPQWVRTLFKLAPEGLGVKGITYFTVVNQTQLLGTERIHPQSELIEEKFVTAVPTDGRIQFQQSFDYSEPVLALWISVDGDDTKSKFEILIEEIEIKETNDK